MSSLGEAKGPRVYREYLGWNSPGEGTHIGRREKGMLRRVPYRGSFGGASHMCEISAKKKPSK